MKIFVTGGTSFVGGYVVQELLKSEIELISILTRKKRTNTARVNYVEGDLRDGGFIRRVLRGHECVVHLAGCKRQQIFHEEVNIHGTRSLVEACRLSPEFKVLIHLSGVNVYGTSRQVLVDEQVTCRPLSSYDKSRYESDLIVQRFASEISGRAIILRCGNIFGENDPDNHLLNLIKKIRSGRFCFVGDDVAGYQVNYIYVKEVAALFERFVKIQGLSNLYIANTPASLSDLVARLKFLTGQTAATKVLPYAPVNIAAKIFDLVPKTIWSQAPINSLKLRELTNKTIYSPSNLIKEFQWTPRYSLETALENLHRHYVYQKLL